MSRKSNKSIFAVLAVPYDTSQMTPRLTAAFRIIPCALWCKVCLYSASGKPQDDFDVYSAVAPRHRPLVQHKSITKSAPLTIPRVQKQTPTQINRRNCPSVALPSRSD